MRVINKLVERDGWYEERRYIEGQEVKDVEDIGGCVRVTFATPVQTDSAGSIPNCILIRHDNLIKTV